MKSQRHLWRLLSVGACALSTVLGAQQSRQALQPDANALKNAAQSKEWLTYGGSYAEMHYSPLRQIDASNLDRLGL